MALRQTHVRISRAKRQNGGGPDDHAPAVPNQGKAERAREASKSSAELLARMAAGG